LLATTGCWQRTLEETVLATRTLEEAASSPVRCAPGITHGGASLGSVADRLAAASWFHRVALLRLAPAAADLALHPSASVRSSAGGMLATVAVHGIDASAASSAKTGSALATVHGVLQGMLPASEEEAEAMANLPVSDPRCTLHNGRVCAAGSAVLHTMRASPMPAALAATLTFAPDVWTRCRAAAGDEEALAKALSSSTTFRQLRAVVVHEEDTGVVAAAADSALGALGAESWATVREAAASGKGAAKRIAALWVTAISIAVFCIATPEHFFVAVKRIGSGGYITNIVGGAECANLPT
jgi:hypothetical protein